MAPRVKHFPQFTCNELHDALNPLTKHMNTLVYSHGANFRGHDEALRGTAEPSTAASAQRTPSVRSSVMWFGTSNPAHFQISESTDKKLVEEPLL